MRFGSAVKLIAFLFLASCGAAPETFRAQYLGSYTWTAEPDWFGGFSGIEMSDDGAVLTALSDQAVVLTGLIVRDGDQIVDIEPGGGFRLLSTTAKPLGDNIRESRDSEGLAIADDGTIFLSFEGAHYVARVDPDTRIATPIASPPEFQKFPGNGSLEALAIDKDGRLYTLPEVPVDSDGNSPVFRWDNGVWTQPFSLPRSGDFLPVGADFGPDGRFYLLERAFSILGFRARVRRWDLTGDTISNEETLLESRSGTHDNLEGLSVWRDEADRLRLTMISDNNFMFFQRSEVVEYVVTE